MYAEGVSSHKQVHPVLNMMFVWGPLRIVFFPSLLHDVGVLALAAES